VIDRALLLGELRKWREHGDILVHSVAAGLITRIERGDFDVVAEERKDKQ
jgi:hypothetical protein